MRDHAEPGLAFVVLAHLSETNNTPDAALECMLEVAGERIEGYGIDVSVAPRHTPSGIIEVRPQG